VQILGVQPEIVAEPSPGPAPRLITGGIVAHNDEHRIARSIRSLLSQDLPAGTNWGRIWVVVSGCTDRTAEVARALSVDEPRLGLVVERERRGKAAAIGEVLRRAEGEYLVLLNSDAVAAPGAVAALMSKAQGKPRPFAVMARPVAPTALDGGWDGTMQWMWEFHHELHREMLANGGGAHLSDELLLVSLPAYPWIEDGIINDGSYCAVWLRNHQGGCWYAPVARVWIDVPDCPSAHLRQRRRIHVGNAQVRSRLGRSPTTAFRYLLEDPVRALRALRRAGKQEHALRHLFRVAWYEMVSQALAARDRLSPRVNHVLWTRIPTPVKSVAPMPVPSSVATGAESAVDRRIRVLLRVAREFGTGVPLTSLSNLLPITIAESDRFEAFLAGRPDLVKVEQGTVFPPETRPPTDETRVLRGEHYLRTAKALVDGPLAWLRPAVRCIAVTGSAAYGEPEEGDDVDFFVVTRAGAVPWFLAATYVSLRLDALRRGVRVDPPPCFNYVVDERRIPVEFERSRGLLFAREALSARVIAGDPYYRGVLRQAPWMGDELPRLFASRTQDPGETRPRAAHPLIRLLGAVTYLPLAAYLQMVGLRRNAHQRRRGRIAGTFRTSTAPDRIAFLSRRFEELRDRYEGEANRPIASYPGVSAPSRIPSSR